MYYFLLTGNNNNDIILYTKMISKKERFARNI